MGLAAFVVINLAVFGGSTVRGLSLLGAMAAFGFVVRSWWALLFALVPILVYLPAGGEGVPEAGGEPEGWEMGVFVVPMLAAAVAAGITAGKLVSLVRRRMAGRASADAG